MPEAHQRCAQSRRSPRLDITPEISTPSDEARSFIPSGYSAAYAELIQLREVRRSGSPRIDECGRILHVGCAEAGECTAIRRMCEQVTQCSVCSKTPIAQDREDISQRLDDWHDLGGRACFVTLTVPHHARMGLDETFERLNRAERRVFKNLAKVKPGTGLIGFERRFDATHGLLRQWYPDPAASLGSLPRNNGWHPHWHIVLYFAPGTTTAQIDKACRRLEAIYLKALGMAGDSAAGQSQPFHWFEIDMDRRAEIARYFTNVLHETVRDLLRAIRDRKPGAHRLYDEFWMTLEGVTKRGSGLKAVKALTAAAPSQHDGQPPRQFEGATVTEHGAPWPDKPLERPLAGLLEAVSPDSSASDRDEAAARLSIVVSEGGSTAVGVMSQRPAAPQGVLCRGPPRGRKARARIGSGPLVEGYRESIRYPDCIEEVLGVNRSATGAPIARAQAVMHRKGCSTAMWQCACTCADSLTNVGTFGFPAPPHLPPFPHNP